MATGTDEIEKASERVGELLAQGRAAYGSGEAELAVGRFGEAASIAEQLVQQLPDNPAALQGFGGVLYELGSAHLAVGRPADAVAALSQALATCAALPPTHQPDPQVLASDVRALRGLAYALGGAGASAVVDVQTAIVSYVQRADQQRIDSDYLGLSRVLMTSSDVLGAYGDPEMGVLAARVGLTWCVEAAKAGTEPDEAMVGAMVRALSTERELLIALERGDETGNAEQALQWLGTEPAPTLVGGRLESDSPGLLLPFDEAVAAAGDESLSTLLLGAPVGPLCAPIFRVAPERLTEAGLAAADAAVRLMDDDPDSAARLGLEGHFLLALAFEQQLPDFVSRSDEASLAWCRMLASVASRCAADGDLGLAADLGQWGLRVTGSLDAAFGDRHADELGAAVKVFESALEN
jgi:tetratricopeptide (TPR) repeat protein